MKLKRLAAPLATGFFLYLFVAITAYRFSHPEMTETELFLAIPKALIWAW